MLKQRSFDVFGNIALVNFNEDEKLTKKQKREFAKEILKKRKSVKTVLEKSSKFKGRLRKIETKHLVGEKNKEVLYKENNCIFRFNIGETYFSTRLANERKEIATKIKKGEKVLVLFAGVAPFSIVIAKNSEAKKIDSNEINRKANKYAEQNIERNKLKEKITLLSGDIKKIAPKLKEKNKKYDVIVMPRPNLKDSFLEQAFMLSKKKTRVYYYCFSHEDELEEMVENIKKQAKESKRKIKIKNIKKAGDIAPYKYRYRIDFVVKK
jgi:tRNA (guanine37-N1)-methyltransferase